MLNKTKLILYVIGFLFVAGSGIGIKVAYNKYKSTEASMVAYRNNQRAYEDIISKKTNDNRVLSLSNADLRDSNDKLVHSMDSVRKSLKTPQNKPGDISIGVNTSIHDTTWVKVKVPAECNVDTILEHNKLTTSHIILKDSMLKDILDVNNSEDLFVYSTREFVNQYKNGWCRFWHFDWHKEDVNRYDIVNSNKLIKTGDVRVVKVRE